MFTMPWPCGFCTVLCDRNCVPRRAVQLPGEGKTLLGGRGCRLCRTSGEEKVTYQKTRRREDEVRVRVYYPGELAPQPQLPCCKNLDQVSSDESHTPWNWITIPPASVREIMCGFPGPSPIPGLAQLPHITQPNLNGLASHKK
jgi:hypothetical protein